MATVTQEPQKPSSPIGEVVESFKAICRMCHGGCGTIVQMVNGTIKKVIGDKSNPVNKGALCSKAGPASIEQLYHPDRLDYQRSAPFRALAREIGESPASLAHWYALSMAGVATVVLGVKNRAELRECITAEARGVLDPELMSRIDAAVGRA